jgi:hypothetical protein
LGAVDVNGGHGELPRRFDIRLAGINPSPGLDVGDHLVERFAVAERLTDIVAVPDQRGGVRFRFNADSA